jgi:hypothetical protein
MSTHDVVVWKGAVGPGPGPGPGSLAHYRLPPEVCATTQEAWMYLVCNFGVWDREVVPAQMAHTLSTRHAHLKTEGGRLNLAILDLLASYLQRTPYAGSTFLQCAPPAVHSGWFNGMQLTCECVWVGEKGGHVELWVTTKQDAYTALQAARAGFPEATIVAGCRKTPFECLVLAREGHPALYVRVVPECERDVTLMEVQPDFRQSMWNPRTGVLSATPRCCEANLRGVCVLSPVSPLGSFARRAGFHVEGGREAGETLRSAHNCLDVSLRGEDDWMLLYWVKAAQNKYDLNLRESGWFPEFRSYFEVQRVWVKRAHGRLLTVTRPGDAPLSSLFGTLHAHLSNVVGDSEEMTVDVGDAQVVHGMTNDELSRVAVGCSLSGTLWFTGQLSSEREVIFEMFRVYVHPSHLAEVKVG